ncbi:MAG: DUF3945 domain-containing protein [Rikenellaceae bacterium]
MEQETKDQEVLLVKEPEVAQVRAVAGIEADGRLKTVAAERQNRTSFLKIGRGTDVLESFFSNFLRQAKEPSHFGFFKVLAEGVEQSAKSIAAAYKATATIDDEVAARSARINPEEYAKSQSQGYKPLDKGRIDWSQFEALGIKREAIEKSGALDEMLNFRKSPDLVNISAKLGDVQIRTQGRLSLREMADGRLIPVIHAIRHEPQLDRPLFGHTFTKEDRENLKATGNMGRVVELVNTKTGEVTSSLISVDRLTNDLVTMRADKLKIPSEIKGVKLTAEQQTKLRTGEAIYLEGMTAKSGKSFDAYVQISAERRGVEFRFDNARKQTQAQPQEFRIPTKLGGKEISPEDRERLKEGGTIYLEALKDRAGKEYNAYIKVSENGDKLNFYRWNPDKEQSQTSEQSQRQESEPHRSQSQQKMRA